MLRKSTSDVSKDAEAPGRGSGSVRGGARICMRPLWREKGRNIIMVIMVVVEETGTLASMITGGVSGIVKTGKKAFPGKGNASCDVKSNLVTGSATGIGSDAIRETMIITTTIKPKRRKSVKIPTTSTRRVLSLVTQLEKDI